MIVNAAPTTTKYTPVSNNKGVPNFPITGICPSIHKACIIGSPRKKGNIAAKKQKVILVALKNRDEILS